MTYYFVSTFMSVKPIHQFDILSDSHKAEILRIVENVKRKREIRKALKVAAKDRGKAKKN